MTTTVGAYTQTVLTFGSYASVSYTDRASTPSPEASAPAPSSARGAGVRGDSVEMTGGSTPPEPLTYGHRSASSRADALFEALDADKDGSITQEEFVSGASALLGRAHGRHHQHRFMRAHEVPADGGHTERSPHSQARHSITDRLTDLFSNLDADGNGGVERSELSTAVDRVSGSDRRRQTRRDVSTEKSADVSAAVGVTVTSVTVVAIAIRRYTSIAASDKSATAASK